MSQNNLTLPTTGTVSGLTMTQDTNAAIDTLNTLSSGTAAPGSPEAGQFWHDTTNNLLKIRSLDNTAWITLFSLNEVGYQVQPPIGGGTATLASATTTNIGSVPQTNITISGTTTITSFGTSMLPGQSKIITFSGALTLTYNATSMILPGAASISTAAGDQAIVQCISSGNYQVLYQTANGKAVVSTSAVPWFAISGCLPSGITGSHTTAAMTVSAGQAADSTNSVFITSTSYSWAASNGNAINGTDAASSTLANSTTYHMYLITGGSGTGVFASATYPASSVTFPSGYRTSARRIFSFNTDASGNPIPYTAIETEGGSLVAWLGQQILDISVSTMTSANRTLYPLTVPTGIKVQPFGRYTLNTGFVAYMITSGDETDYLPTETSYDTFTAAPGYDMANTNSTVSTPSGGSGILTTNTSGQIGARTNSATTAAFYWVTRGFKDFRRS